MSADEILVWCLLGRKAGDNNQVLALALELGWGYREKHVLARPWEVLTHIGHRATLAGIDRASSTALQPPWPDLVITAGRRNEPVAHWIKRQSGGNSVLVHMGRPWSPLDSWDLLVTTPQYFLPQQDNILHNDLPLNRLLREDLSAAARGLRPHIEDLPRPWIAVLVGGDSGRFVFTADKGERLGQMASELAGSCGGSLLVTDSPRTPPVAADALQARLTAPHYCYRWHSGGDNPYRGLLGLADAFVVTGESMSMLGEAVAMGRPLYIFDMGDGATPWWRVPHSYRYKPLSHHLAMRFGPTRMRREIGKIQDQLVSSGRARWLGRDSIAGAASEIQLSPSDLPGQKSVAQEELRRTAAVVRRLVTAR